MRCAPRRSWPVLDFSAERIVPHTVPRTLYLRRPILCTILMCPQSLAIPAPGRSTTCRAKASRPGRPLAPVQWVRFTKAPSVSSPGPARTRAPGPKRVPVTRARVDLLAFCLVPILFSLGGRIYFFSFALFPNQPPTQPFRQSAAHALVHPPSTLFPPSAFHTYSPHPHPIPSFGHLNHDNDGEKLIFQDEAAPHFLFLCLLSFL